MPVHRILHIIPGLGVGGAEAMVGKLIPKMDRTRWSSSVVSLTGRGVHADRLEECGVDVTTMDMRGRYPGIGTLLRFRTAVRRSGPELLQGWMYHGNLAALGGRAIGKRRCRLVWNIRSDVFDFGTDRWLLAAVVRVCALFSGRADRIIYNSHASARRHADLGYSPRRAVVIPNGFDTTLFAPSSAARASFRKRLGVGNGTVLIGRVGRYHRMKDFRGFLEAAAILSRRHAEVQFVIAGPGVNANNKELLQAMERYGVTTSVHVLGETSAMPELMAGLDILCSSSAYSESFPNVLGEALSCQVPCVTTDVGDSGWVVGDAGYVVPPRDPEALAAACGALIEAGPAGRQRLGAIGRARVIHDFSIERIASQYDDLYSELLDGR